MKNYEDKMVIRSQAGINFSISPTLITNIYIPSLGSGIHFCEILHPNLDFVLNIRHFLTKNSSNFSNLLQIDFHYSLIVWIVSFLIAVLS